MNNSQLLIFILYSSISISDQSNVSNETSITVNNNKMIDVNTSSIISAIASKKAGAKTHAEDGQLKKLNKKLLSKYMMLLGADSSSPTAPIDFDLLNKVLFIFGSLVIITVLLSVSAYISFRKNDYKVKRGSRYYRAGNVVRRLKSNSHQYNSCNGSKTSFQVESIPLKQSIKVSF